MGVFLLPLFYFYQKIKPETWRERITRENIIKCVLQESGYVDHTYLNQHLTAGLSDCHLLNYDPSSWSSYAQA
jgi:hypothetical protein